eukprot:360210-Rhodomonas_salina.1
MTTGPMMLEASEASQSSTWMAVTVGEQVVLCMLPETGTEADWELAPSARDLAVLLCEQSKDSESYWYLPKPDKTVTHHIQDVAPKACLLHCHVVS